MTIWEQAYLVGVIGTFVAVGLVFAYYARLQAEFDRKKSVRQPARLSVRTGSHIRPTATRVDRGL